MCTKRLVQFIPYNYTVSSTVPTGILTSGSPPCFNRSMRTGPRHWRARAHREITSVFFKFPKCFSKLFVSVFSRLKDFVCGKLMDMCDDRFVRYF